MESIKKFLKNFEEYLSALLLACMVILIFMQIVFRFLLNLPLRWTEESARYSMILLIYLSACSGVKKEKHIRIEAIHDALPQKAAFVYWLFSNVIWFVFNTVMIYFGIKMALHIYSTGQVSPVLHVSMGLLYMVIPVCFTIMNIRIIQLVISRIQKEKAAVSQPALPEENGGKSI